MERGRKLTGSAGIRKNASIKAEEACRPLDSRPLSNAYVSFFLFPYSAGVKKLMGVAPVRASGASRVMGATSMDSVVKAAS